MHRFIDGGNTVVPMSINMVYQSNTNQDIVLHQFNPSYIKASDINIYDEIPANQYEEPVVSQGNKEDQDNGSYVSQGNKEDQDYSNAGVTDDKAQAQDIKGSCENLQK